MLTIIAKNEMLDGLFIDLMSLHTGDPGPSGTANEVSGSGYVRKECAFSVAVDAESFLSAKVDFVGPPSGPVAFIGLWVAGSPATFKGSIQITSGDVQFNAVGEYGVTTANKISLSDA
jgi:hypothetical protein